MRDYVLIYVNGQRHQLRGPLIFRSLSDYLRKDLGLTGTKVACAEGDCGACSVLIGRPYHHAIEYRAACSCIQYLYQLDGTHIVTVEGISAGGGLTPVQQALVRSHGTQCGYCSPGMVIAIHALVESGDPLTEQTLRRGLAGTLCRCTGYQPILNAGLEVEISQVRRLGELYDSTVLRTELISCAHEPVHVEADEKTFFKPATISDAAQFKMEHPDCVIVAGGTDLGVQINKGSRVVRNVLSTMGIAELQEMEVTGSEIVAGASAPLTDLQSLASNALPEFATFLGLFGSPQIKNVATLGGNIANGSPVGDTMPALFVLNAEVELARVGTRRRVPINDFYTGYKSTVAKPDELITRVFIPLLGDGEVIKLYKASKRKDMDISTVSAAFWLRLVGSRIDDVRIAYGGVGPRILRMPLLEAHLRGAEISEGLFEAARGIAVSEVTPISDVRGSAEYRNALVSNLVRKLYFDLRCRKTRLAVATGR
jgi:xanthine dehydrogenase small subunit